MTSTNRTSQHHPAEVTLRHYPNTHVDDGYDVVALLAPAAEDDDLLGEADHWTWDLVIRSELGESWVAGGLTHMPGLLPAITAARQQWEEEPLPHERDPLFLPLADELAMEQAAAERDWPGMFDDSDPEDPADDFNEQDSPAGWNPKEAS